MSYRIEAIDRLTNSRNGNPRFCLALAELDENGEQVDPIVVINTAADAAFGYEIGNPGYRVGDIVSISTNRRGTIYAMESAS